MPLPSISSMPPAAMLRRHCSRCSSSAPSRGSCGAATAICISPILRLVDGRPLLFDAIEFDPVIATTDVLYDLAFTLMDLVHFDQAAAANAVFNRYLAGAGDEDLDGLRRAAAVSFGAGGNPRACAVHEERTGGGRSDAVWREARRYFDLAGRLIVPKPPLLVAIGGLSGTGKSVLARGLAGLIEPPPGAVIIRSDVVRKHLFGVGETTALPEQAYRADVIGACLRHAFETAQRVLAQGFSVVLDAAYPGSGTDGNCAFAATYGMPLCRSVPDGGSGDAAGADRAAKAMRPTRPGVALEQEAFAIGAVNWHMIDASGTPDQSLRSASASLFAVPGER